MTEIVLSDISKWHKHVFSSRMSLHCSFKFCINADCEDYVIILYKDSKIYLFTGRDGSEIKVNI